MKTHPDNNQGCVYTGFRVSVCLIATLITRVGGSSSGSSGSSSSGGCGGRSRSGNSWMATGGGTQNMAYGSMLALSRNIALVKTEPSTIG